MPQPKVDNISKLYKALKDSYEVGTEDDFRKYLSDGDNREALRQEIEGEYETGDSIAFSHYLGYGRDNKLIDDNAITKAQQSVDAAYNSNVAASKATDIPVAAPKINPSGALVAGRLGGMALGDQPKTTQSTQSQTAKPQTPPTQQGQAPQQTVQQPAAKQNVQIQPQSTQEGVNGNQGAGNTSWRTEKITTKVGDVSAGSVYDQAYQVFKDVYNNEKTPETAIQALGKFTNDNGIDTFEGQNIWLTVADKFLKEKGREAALKVATQLTSSENLPRNLSLAFYGDDNLNFIKDVGKRSGLDKNWFIESYVKPELLNLLNEQFGDNWDPGILTGLSTDFESIVGKNKDWKELMASIDQAYAERDRLGRLIDEAKRNGGDLAMVASMGGDRTSADYSGNPKYQELLMLQSAYDKNEQLITTLEAERNDPGFWGGVWDKVSSTEFLSRGISEMQAQGNLSKIKDKIEGSGTPGLLGASYRVKKGPRAFNAATGKFEDAYTDDLGRTFFNLADAAESQLGIDYYTTRPDLTSGEKELLQAAMLSNQAKGMYNQNRGDLYNYGQGFGESLGLMFDFLMTGGYRSLAQNVFRSGSKMGMKYANSTLAKYLVNRLGVTGNVANKFIQSSIKGASSVLGTTAAGAAQTMTVGAPRLFADTYRDYVGNIDVENGRIVFKDGKDFLDAFIGNIFAHTGENASELMGMKFDFGLDFIKRGLKKNLQIDVLPQSLYKLTRSNAWKTGNKALRSVGIASTFGEWLEEQYGGLWDVATGQSKWFKDNPSDNEEAFLDPKAQWDTAVQTLIVSGLLRAPQMTVFGYQQAVKTGYKTNLSGSRRQLRKVFGDRYEPVKNAIDNSTNEDLGNVLYNIAVNGQLTDTEKQAALTYAHDLAKYRGFEIGALLAEGSGITPAQRVSSFTRNGNIVTSYDEKGQVIDKHEYDDEEAAKAGVYNLQQERDESDLQSDIVAMSARDGNAYNNFVEQYCAENGVDNEVLQSALDKPVMERTDDEFALTESFAKSLHNAVYDNTILHEGQSAKDGEKAADVIVLGASDPDASPLEGPVVIGGGATEIRDSWLAAEAAYNELLDRNEILAEEIRVAEEQGLSAQAIISRLDSFSNEEVQTVINYFNQKARFEGFMNETANKINEEAENFKTRHTFTGTINGQEDKTNLVEIVDDEGNRYTLVSGNITTNDAGFVTGSDSGMLIGIDENGDFVTLNDKNITVLPTQKTLDDATAAERERIGQSVSIAIDPEQRLNPQQAANETSAEEMTELPVVIGGFDPSVYNGRVVADGDRRVTPTEGGDRYEQDYLIDGKHKVTVVEEPNSNGNYARFFAFNGEDYTSMDDVISEINVLYGEPQQTTEEEPVVETPADEEVPEQPTNTEEESVKETPTEEKPAVAIESVADKDGIKRYENGVEVDDAIADIQADGFDVNEVADASIAEAQQTIDKINKKSTKTRKDLIDRKNAQNVVDYYNNVKARWAEISAEISAESEENINVQPKQQTTVEKPVPSSSKLTVEEQKQQRIAEAKAKYGEFFDDDFTYARDVKELVSMWIGRKRNLAWEDVNGKRGLQKELGWTRRIGGDTKYIETILAKNGEGVSVNDFVHMVWESQENHDEHGEKRWDDQEIRNALLELLKGASSKSDVVDYALNTRIAQAEATLRKEQELAQEAAERGETIEPLTDGEIAEIENNLPFPMPTDEDIPNSQITQLEKAVEELSSQDGMPNINLVDTDRMTNDDWYDLASRLMGGAFPSEEDIEKVRNYVLENGVFYDPETGIVTIFSGNQTAEDVKQKLEQIKSYINDRIQEERRNDGQDTIVQRPQEGTSTGEAAETTTTEGTEDSAGTTSDESVVDDYLKPRNAEEEKIVQGVVVQLQQEIQAAIDEQTKARSELQKAQAKESERATDLFGNDNALNQPGQLFDNSDMPVDQSVEGVERRTATERKRLQEATNKLNQLQSPEERNSRIRGALDNYRRQTSIEDIDERQKREYDEYIKPLLRRSDEELQQMAKAKEDAVGGDLNQLAGDLEYSAIKNVLAQREIDRLRKDVKVFVENAIDDEDITFVDKATYKEVDELNRLIDEYGVDDAEGKIEDYVNRLRKKYPVENIREKGTDNPVVAIEQAAQQFREEQELKKEYGANNKLVTTDRYEELKKRMRDKLRGQLNSGFDPELISIGAEMAMYHIEAGAKKFADYATRMIADLGDVIRPYLQSFYEAARRMPGMEDLRKEMDSTETVDNFDVLNYDKQGDNTVNEHKEENNEAENVVSSQQETSEEVERNPEDAAKYRQFSQAVANDLLNAMETGEKPYKSIKDIRKKAREVGLEVDEDGRTDILLQELVEDGIVSAARQYVNTYVIQQMLAGKTTQEARTSRDLFNDIVRLYNLQPSITQRSSNRIKMQQYSTPLPMSFIADVFAFREGMQDVLEPTAGNGMMVFAVPEFTVHANELDGTRLDNLRAQKFKKVTDQDATQPFEGDEQYDAIVANPPFGSVEPKEYDGKIISGLEEQIALNALEKMKDDGKAAIIIGGNMEYAPNGAIKSNKAFMTYLYDHYNVKGVIDMDGKLYAKQGTTYPTRLILIDGRRSEEERAQTKVYPPVKSMSPKKATTFDELFDIAEKIRNDKYKTNGNEQPRVLRSTEQTAEPVVRNTSRQADNGRLDSQSENGNRKVERVRGGLDSRSENDLLPTSGNDNANRGRRTSGEREGDLFADREDAGPVREQRQKRNTSEGSRSGAETPTNERRTDGGTDVGRSRPVDTPNGNIASNPVRKPVSLKEEKRNLGSDKLSYRPHNTAFSLESVAPAAMVEAMDKTLAKIENEEGDIDEFVTRELGYNSIEEMHNALAAEQVDSVAMAIWNMKNGEGMIIGDQTGVGKGRQMAALIRWAVKQGKKPIFVTKDADLFSDIYRDLVDIGSADLKPFIFNSGVTITDTNGVVVHKSLSSATQKKVLEMNELPDGFDFAILSYTQMNTGDKISQEESGKSAKERGERGAKKGKAVKSGKPTPKADFLRRIAKDNYLLMDESQNAAGSGNTGAYFQSILKDAKAVTFASATFAKRPDTMPLYAIRTAISKAKVKTWELLQMIGKGGVTLQEIMSRAMTQAGQMVRRERDMSDVKTDWKTITDKETSEKARRNYDNVMRAFNAIINFQDNYIKPALAAKSAEYAEMASEVSSRRGTEKAGVDNPPFVNRLYNFSKQLLLSLKVDAIVDEVAKEIEEGRHPVIALENTLESAIEDYSVGDVIEDPTLFGKLKKGLDATFRYTLKNEDGDEMGGELQPHELGSEGEQAYYDLVDLIKESTQGMFISPLDAITEKLESRGYKVGEISGRKSRAVKNGDGQYVVRKRENTDRKKLARDFNSGELDVLIINKTGSTGISLHASKRFKDQRQRTMIMAQPLSDINDYMQMIGRIDRTGQVHRGYYINLGLPVPAETRFMMMLANKLKSLNANTTTSQENKDNDVDAPDLLNKYGDQIMIEYLRDNPDIYRKLGEFLKDGKERGSEGVSAARLDEYQPKEGDARQITGRVALLSVDEQDAFYDDVTRRYNELIKYLNDTGSNDLKISVLPLNARTIDSEVSSEGTAPNSGNPFADNAYVEWVEMDILKKPMKASDVRKTIEQLSPEGRKEQIISTVEKETQEKLDKENARYEAAKKRAEEDIEAKAEAINKQQKRTPEQKKEAIDKYAAERRKSVEESHQNMVNKIDANHERLMRYLNMFDAGQPVLVPDDLTTDAFLGSSNGIFCGFKAKDEGITPSTTLAVFATLDGRRKIEVKLSDWGALTRIDNMTQQNWDAAYDVTLDNWDEKIPSSSRKKGYIMTGNILQAISDTNFQGRLVTFTDDKGNVRDGVLMPDKWEPSQLKGSTVPISARKERITSMPMKESVTSSDGRVTITRYWSYYYLDVPKSKKLGGEFYLDKSLLDLVEGNDFFTAGGKMRGRVDNNNINAVIDRLGELSVTLPSDKKVEFNEEDNTSSNTGRRFDEDIEESESNLNNQSKDISYEKKDITLQAKERKYGKTDIERVFAGNDALARTFEEAGNTGVRDSSAEEVERGSGSKRSVLRNVVQRAKENNVWVEDIQHDLAGDYIGSGQENQVFLSKDGKNVIKLNNFEYVPDDAANLDAFVDRIRAHNELFPSERMELFGFTRNAKGEVSAIIKQPFVDAEREATDAEIDKFLEDLDFTVDMSDEWTNGKYGILDLKPSNVLVDKDGRLRFVDVVVRDMDRQKKRTRFKEDNEAETKSQSAKHKQHIAKHIDNLLEKLGTKSRTTVYNSLEEVPKDVRKHIEEAHKRGRKVRGWYENGQIYLFLPDIDSTYQAEQTIWHETVAHHGLRELIGAENYNDLLKRLWLEYKDGDMGKWVTERMQQNGWSLSEAIDEYLAREAEKNPFKQPGLWQRLQWWLSDILHKMGFGTDPTISDIQYLFWVSQNQLRENDPMSKIKQQAFLHNLNRSLADAPYVNMNASTVEDIENPEAEGSYDDGVRHSEETDEEVIERLEKEPKVKVYRAMQLIDGKLYPPMAAKQGGKLVNPIELGKWEKADEHPEMADNNGKFKLDKGNGKSLKAAYNPYIHTSTSMLNDQFSEAQSRPNLVVVEVEVPESELTSGYKADKAKDTVGKIDWKAGVVQGQLSGTREVILSRWDKPIRIVPVEEVAKSIAEQIKGKVDVMPSNVVTPQQREALEKEGVKFVETDNQGKITSGEDKGKTYSSVYGKRGGRRYDEDIDDPVEYSARKAYEERLDRASTMFTEAWQDNMVSVRQGMNAIAKDKDVPDSQNVYMQTGLVESKTFVEQEEFKHYYMKPFKKIINKILAKTGWKTGDIDRYVFTKHGFERNRVLFVRDWMNALRSNVITSVEQLSSEAQDIFERKAMSIEDRFESGEIDETQKENLLKKALQEANNEYLDDIQARFDKVKDDGYTDVRAGAMTFSEYLDSIDEFIRDNIDHSFDASENDYSGFTEMYGDENGKYDEADILEELMNMEDAMDTSDGDLSEELWKNINRCSQYALDKYRTAGMMNEETYDRIRHMFHYYVPMRGLKEGTRAEEHWQYMRSQDRGNSLGNLLKKAKGRKSKANYPISTLFALANDAIRDGNQNIVKQYLWRLCQANENDLIVTSDSWVVLDPATDEWVVAYPEIEDDMVTGEVLQKVEEFDKRMKDLERDGQAQRIRGKAKFPYRIDSKRKNEHIVEVMINGDRKRMIVVGNPRMAQAINGDLKFESGKSFWNKYFAQPMLRYMSAISTSFNLNFVPRNMLRDFTHFSAILTVKEGAGYTMAAEKYYAQSFPKMISLFKKWRKGTLDESKEIERDFKDFMEYGGITGFVHMQKLEDYQRKMEKEISKLDRNFVLKFNDKMWDCTLGAIEAMNEAVENNARFATYRASRHYAKRTRDRSAYDAKEVTANFNRRGAGKKTSGFKSEKKGVEAAANVYGASAQVLRSNKMFFNATMQALATIFKGMRNSDGSMNWKYISRIGTRYAGTQFALGLAMPYLNGLLMGLVGGDDDDNPYANLPEWVRRKNLCLYMGWVPGAGKDTFLTIPLGQELAAFYSLGDMMAGLTYAPELRPVDSSIYNEIVGFSSVFSPVDFDRSVIKDWEDKDVTEKFASGIIAIATLVNSSFAPISAINENLSWTGKPIYREDRFPNDKHEPEYRMTYNSTNPQYVGISKWLNDISGGDDVKRGSIQVNPGALQYLTEQYTGGPGKLFANTALSAGKDLMSQISTGEAPDFNVRKIEGARAFWTQGDERTQYFRTNAKYWNYQKNAKKFEHDLKGYKKDMEENPEHKMKYDEMTKGADYARYELIKEANRNSKKEGKVGLKDQYKNALKLEGNERKEALRQYNERVSELVEKLDSIGNIK